MSYVFPSFAAACAARWPLKITARWCKVVQQRGGRDALLKRGVLGTDQEWRNLALQRPLQLCRGKINTTAVHVGVIGFQAIRLRAHNAPVDDDSFQVEITLA